MDNIKINQTDDMSLFCGDRNLLFHQPVWLEAFKDSNKKTIYLLFLSNGKIIGKISGLLIQSNHNLLSVISKQIYFFSGPCMIQDDAFDVLKCYNKLKEYSIENGINKLKIGSYDYPIELNIEGSGFNKRIREEYIVNLKPDLEDIYKRFKRDQQWRIRKAIKSNLNFLENFGKSALDNLFYCMGYTKKRKMERGFRDYAFYQMDYINESVLLRLMEMNIAHIYEVHKKNELISSCFVITYEKRAYYLLSGSNSIGYKSGAPAFLFWKIVEKLKEKKYCYINKGGIPEGDSGTNIARNKVALGGQKNICTVAYITNLQRPIINLLSNLYYKIC